MNCATADGNRLADPLHSRSRSIIGRHDQRGYPWEYQKSRTLRRIFEAIRRVHEGEPRRTRSHDIDAAHQTNGLRKLIHVNPTFAPI